MATESKDWGTGEDAGRVSAEFVRDMQRTMPEGDTMTIRGEGRSVTLHGGGGARQAVMAGVFPDARRYVEQVVDTARELASSTMDRGLTAAVQSKIEIAGQFETDEGVLMDAVISISLKAKPAKVE